MAKKKEIPKATVGFDPNFLVVTNPNWKPPILDEIQPKLPMPVAYNIKLQGGSRYVVRLNGQDFIYKQGEWIVVPPNVYHLLKDAGEIADEREPLYE